MNPIRLTSVLVMTLMLSACGLSISLSVNGEIDHCVDEIRWNQSADFVSGAGRYENAEAAVQDVLSLYLEKYGGEIRRVNDDTAALVVEGAEKVVALAGEQPLGGWEVIGVTGCGEIQSISFWSTG